MSLNRQEKAVVIEEVSAQVAKAQSIVIAEYRGLDVASVTVLRKNCASIRRVPACSEEHAGPSRCQRHGFRAVVQRKLTGPLIYGISADPVARGQGPLRLRQNQRQAGHQGGLAAQQPVEPRRRQGPGHAAFARRVAVEVDGHHASPDCAICAYAQRSSDQVRPRPRSRARPEGRGLRPRLPGIRCTTKRHRTWHYQNLEF